MNKGLAGNIAKHFIESKLSLLLMIAFLLIGIYSSMIIPREEEPQIIVPVTDIFIGYPGASPKEVESRISKPLEKIISNIHGVKYVYSTSMKDQAMMIVQFEVGEDVEQSMVKVYNEINKNMDDMPPNVTMPLVKIRAIDDVPLMTLTLWSEIYDDYQLRQVAQELNHEIDKIDNVAITKIIGGRSRELRVIPKPMKMGEMKIDVMHLRKAIKEASIRIPSGSIVHENKEIKVQTGNFISSSRELENLIIGVQNNKPIYLYQVANVVDGPSNSSNYTSFGYGVGDKDQFQNHPDTYPSVSITIAKRKGADAMKISKMVERKIEILKSSLLPKEIIVETTRNYGETASQKVSELLLHLFGAIIAVTFVVMLAMGWRGGLVVFLSVPITFALTMFSYYFMDYTFNRITLFALVFVTGIVVDDSIIIAENMHRHFKMRKLPFKEAAIYAINEVGNPTILATFTVIAAVLPMAFVSGLMGPYMSPMPIGASLAMLFSLFVALTITPYLGYHILRFKEKKTEEKPHRIEDSSIYKVYSFFANPLLDKKWLRWLFLSIITVLSLAAMYMFVNKAVLVKMLPFDNKNEFQVVIDMPEGTTLETTNAVAQEIGDYISRQEYTLNYQIYSGTSAPITFNGLVRHYDIRQGPTVADVQVNLLNKQNRSKQSHEIAKEYRPAIQEIASKYEANVKLVEVPPGPPVLSTIVAEIYGPDYEQQINIAEKVKGILYNTVDVVDIDWMVEDQHEEYNIIINREKASRLNIGTERIAASLNTLMSDQAIAFLYDENSYASIPINLQLTKSQKSEIDNVLQSKIISNQGIAIPIGDLVSVKKEIAPQSIFRKNQKRVVYVTADLAGKYESPVYPILEMEEKLDAIKLPAGYILEEKYAEQPFSEENYTVKWDGEWQITLEVFRDLGIAFGVVLLIIYILIVGWFQNFKAPFVMMVAIPLSLIGIVLGHWFFDAFFTATSMIGMIALAGVMVRNSVLLIDFINLRLKDGIPFKQAIIEAGAVRTTPILLTAGTVVIGAFVILFDPIFQGLAISLMGGSIASTFLTLLVVPLVYYMTEKKNYQ
jgi:multidrug efflux pump subunit AcrB